MAIEVWLLTAPERGNPASDLPVSSGGNQAAALIHGATYFDRLVTEVAALEAAERGVVVKGLIWLVARRACGGKSPYGGTDPARSRVKG